MNNLRFFVLAYYLLFILSTKCDDFPYFIKSPNPMQPVHGSILHVDIESRAAALLKHEQICLSWSPQFATCIIQQMPSFSTYSSGWSYSRESIPSNCDAMIQEKEICSSQMSYTLSGFHTGSMAFVFYKRDEHNRFAPALAMIDLVNNYLPSYQTTKQTTAFEQLVSSNNPQEYENTLFLNQLHPEKRSLAVKKKQKYRKHHQQVLRIGFFLKEIVSHGANNRLIDWICSLGQNSDRVEVYVITPPDHQLLGHDASLAHRLTETCQATLYTPHSLAMTEIEAYHRQPETSQRTDLIFLMDHLLDALVLTNTLGDRYTDTLLEVVAACASPPIVLFDLSNVAVPSQYVQHIDLLLTPSFAAAFLPDTLQHGLPVAMIYPIVTAADYLQHHDIHHTVPVDHTTDHSTTLLYIGRLDEEKSVSLLIKAINYLAQQHDDISAVQVSIIGSGPLLLPLQHLVNQCQLTDQITFLGTMSAAQIASYLHKLRHSHPSRLPILVNPRISGETFGYVHVEAALLGLPVIAFNRGAAAENILSGLLIDLPDEEVNNEMNEVQLLAQALWQGMHTLTQLSPETIISAVRAKTQFHDVQGYQTALLQVIEYFLISE